MSALPSYETAPHFEEDVMDRIRSGEALRPTVVEWLSEWLQPARMRPAFLAGATACAVWVAFLIANPTPSTMVASRTPSPANTTAARSVDPGSVDAAAQPPAATPGLPAGSETIAAGPRAMRTSSGAGSEAVASTAPSALSQDASADSSRGNGSMYQDEYILDQFYLNRSSENGVHSIVPVTGRASDDVYITF